MSGLKSTPDVTTEIGFDDLITEICANDVRTVSGINYILNIFQKNVEIFNEYDDEMKLIVSFHEVKSRSNVVVNCFNELFKEAVNIDEKIKNSFFEVLPFISKDCIRIKGNFTLACATTLKPYCICNILDLYKNGDHLLTDCGLKGNGGISPEKKNQIIIKAIMEHTGDIFKDKVINGLKPFQNPDVGILLGSALTTSAYRDKLIKLNDAAAVFYNNLAGMFGNKTYEHFTDDEKRDFHFCVLELFSFETNDNEGYNVVHSFVKKNVTKLGIYYYIQLMYKLVMAGWYGIDEFRNEIKQIACLETIWVNDVKELPNVKALFNKLLFFSFVDDVNEKENNLKNLKKLGEYIAMADFNNLMLIFNDNNIYCNGYHQTYDRFYNSLKKIYADTLKNGLKRN